MQGQEGSVISTRQIHSRGGTVLSKDFHANRAITGKSVHEIYSKNFVITIKLFDSFLS